MSENRVENQKGYTRERTEPSGCLVAYLPGSGPVGPSSMWAATSNVEV